MMIGLVVAGVSPSSSCSSWLPSPRWPIHTVYRVAIRSKGRFPGIDVAIALLADDEAVVDPVYFSQAGLVETSILLDRHIVVLAPDRKLQVVVISDLLEFNMLHFGLALLHINGVVISLLQYAKAVAGQAQFIEIQPPVEKVIRGGNIILPESRAGEETQ